MGLFDSIFGSKSESSTSFRPLNKREKELQKLALGRVQQTEPLFADIVDRSQLELPGANALIGRELSRGLEFGNLFSPQQQAEADVAAQQRVGELGGTDANILQQILQLTEAGPVLTPEQQARIQEAADLTVQSGLSDLGRFQDQAFEGIRTSAASRGLRPSDAPLTRQLTDLGEQFGRQAQNLVGDVRTQQLLQELNLPLSLFSASLGGLGSASDVANRQRQFELGLTRQAEAQRLGLGEGLRQQAGGLASGSNPASTFSQVLAPAVPQSVSRVDTPSPFEILTGFGFAGGGAIASDERLKEDVEPIDSRRIFDEIRGVKFRYKDPSFGEGERVGIMAQDLQRAGLGFAVVEDDEGRLFVDTAQLTPPILGLLVDVNERLERLEG